MRTTSLWLAIEIAPIERPLPAPSSVGEGAALAVRLRGQSAHRPRRRASGAKRPRAADFNLAACRTSPMASVSGV